MLKTEMKLDHLRRVVLLGYLPRLLKTVRMKIILEGRFLKRKYFQKVVPLVVRYHFVEFPLHQALRALVMILLF